MQSDTSVHAPSPRARRSGSATGHAYDQIKAAILEGRYAPGTRLTEDELAADLGVSRTPVREAVRQLQSEMLLAAVPRFGLTVAVTTMSDLEEIFEVRWLVEGYAARLAAKRITKGELLALASASERIAEAAAAGDRAAVVRGNIQFHRQILDAAHNRRLLLVSRSLMDALEFAIGRLRLTRTDGMVTEHGRIVAALQSGDADAAEAAAREHVLGGLEFHAQSFANEPPGDSAHG